MSHKPCLQWILRQGSSLAATLYQNTIQLNARTNIIFSGAWDNRNTDLNTLTRI